AEDAARCRAVTGCESLMLGRGAVSDPGLALAIAQPGRAPLSWVELMPHLAAFWALVQGKIEPKARGGRLKQWLFYLRRRYPEAEEMHARLRPEQGMVADLSWPEADPALLVAEAVTIAVQVMCKLRGTVTVPPDSAAETVIAAAEAEPNVAKALEGKRIVKRVHVPNHIVNFVVAG
ncbi:MAG: hypothetical protein J0H35_03090, partial [Rhodospirillales bacterium]|nr:hypothetical protein [Rhodospirillales bacterium]